MKINKIISIVLLVFTFIFNNVSFCYAKNDIENSTNNNLVDFIIEIYTTSDTVDVYNNDCENITQMFFDETLHWYYEHNYDLIEQYINMNVYQISIETISFENKNTRSPFVTQNVSEKICQIVNDGACQGNFIYTISGSFVWDRSTYQITSKSNTTITMISENFGNDWKSVVSSVSTKSELSSDKYYVTFSGTIKLKTYVGDIFYKEVGPYNGSVTAHPEG